MPGRGHAGGHEVGPARQISPDAGAIAAELTARRVSLNLGGSVHPTDAVGKLLFNVLAMVAEFETTLIRIRTREGMRRKGRGAPAR